MARDGVFNPRAVSKLMDKARAGQVASTRDGMAVVGVLSTQILIDRFVNNFDRQTKPEKASHDRAA